VATSTFFGESNHGSTERTSQSQARAAQPPPGAVATSTFFGESDHGSAESTSQSQARAAQPPPGTVATSTFFRESNHGSAERISHRPRGRWLRALFSGNPTTDLKRNGRYHRRAIIAADSRETHAAVPLRRKAVG